MAKPVQAVERVFAAMLLALAFAAPSALASEIGDLKAAGLVGEQSDGYVGIVSPPGAPDVRALVDDVNARRRASYRGIADRNGIDLTAVELAAAEKAIARTPAGQFIRLPSGSWRRK